MALTYTEHAHTEVDYTAIDYACWLRNVIVLPTSDIPYAGFEIHSLVEKLTLDIRPRTGMVNTAGQLDI
jgi:hypothetical protein